MEPASRPTLFGPAETRACRQLIELALKEDLDSSGDVTSKALIPADRLGQAVLIVRQAGVLAGLQAAELTFACIDPALSFKPKRQDGSRLQPGDQLALVQGSMGSILAGERTALNFLQHLCGIATLTQRYVDAIAGSRCRILDTRKTIPGWRLLEKHAVRCGGGHNHRMGLYDGILVKDNHLAAMYPTLSIREVIERLCKPTMPLEIEVDTLDQLDEALAGNPDIILLDNMSPEKMREAVRRRNAVAPGVLLEASGGVTLETVRALAETGVDRISVGALTHSAPALDIALDYLP